MREVHDNIVDAKESWIIHGCNAQGVMGSGIAKALRDKWPKVYRSYYSHLQQFPQHQQALGTIDLCVVDDRGHKVVINAITQQWYGRDGKKYAFSWAIENALNQLGLINNHKHAIASAKIGCGLGGLDWKDIKKIFLDVEQKYGFEFVIYDNGAEPSCSV